MSKTERLSPQGAWYLVQGNIMINKNMNHSILKDDEDCRLKKNKVQQVKEVRSTGGE